MATILAAGTTAATSSDVTLADGASANLVAYGASGVAVPAGLRLQVMADTAGLDTCVGVLDPADPDKAGLKVSGPGTFRVVRPPCPVNIGVDSL